MFFDSSDELKNLNLPFFKRRPREQFMSANAYSTLSTSFILAQASFSRSPNDSSSKTMKNAIFFLIKSSFHSQDIHIFVIFPFLSTLSRFKRKIQVELFTMSQIGLHKLADVSFRIIQKPLYITS